MDFITLVSRELMKLTTIDLNADLGETVNDYIDLLPIITSANVACGAHAGGGELLVQTVEAAVKNNVQVGAHPSYPDRENFGRVSMKSRFSKEELSILLKEQISLVITELQKHGKVLSHVKAHGALYNDAVVDHAVAEAIVESASGYPIFGLPNSVLETVANAKGVPFIAEGYMDRAYTNQGALVPRSVEGAVHSHDLALKQIEQLCKTGTLTSLDGEVIDLNIQTLCIHADTPDADKTAREVKELLLSNGINIEPFKAQR